MNAKLVIPVLFSLGTLVRAQTLPGNQPVWKAESDQASAGFGSAVAKAGDVNGDGYGDIIVGAYNFNGGLGGEGGASVFHGSSEGPSKTPDWSAVGAQQFANFGGTVAGAGDVNGDGYDDVIVGAHQARSASLYLGSAIGLAPSAAWTVSAADYDFGWSVASAGDVNGDGYDDVLVSALQYSNGQPSEGRVYAYLGSAAGLQASPAWAVEGDQSYSWFGGWVSSAGDVDGDGFDDVIIGAPRWNNGQNDEGRAFAYLGSAAGLATSPAWTVESNQANALFAQWVGTAGDVNADGYDDVIVSANTWSGGQSDEGGAFVYHGSAVGLAPTPAWTVESDQFTALAGAVSSGDLDGDGYSDVIVGFYAYNHPQVDEGAAFVFFGSGAGLATRAGRFVESNQRNSMFGSALAGAGDVNGDGFDDLLVGAYDFDAGQRNEGRAFAYLGSSRRRLP